MKRLSPKEQAFKMYKDVYEVLTIKSEYSFSHDDSIKVCILSVNNIIEAITFDWMEVQNMDRQLDYWDNVKSYLIEQL